MLPAPEAGAAPVRSLFVFGAQLATASPPVDRFDLDPDADPTDALLLRIGSDRISFAVPTPAEHGALA
jgi:hypothetical protein